jgi:hypothetical protein
MTAAAAVVAVAVVVDSKVARHAAIVRTAVSLARRRSEVAAVAVAFSRRRLHDNSNRRSVVVRTALARRRVRLVLVAAGACTVWLSYPRPCAVLCASSFQNGGFNPPPGPPGVFARARTHCLPSSRACVVRFVAGNSFSPPPGAW